MTQTETAPALPDLSGKVNHWPEIARKAIVIDEQTAEDANNLLQGITLLSQEVHEQFDPICDQTHKAWKAATAARTNNLQPLEEASKILRQAIASWAKQEEDRRRQEAARIEAEMLRQQEEKRLADAEKVLKRTGSEEAAMQVLEAPMPAIRVVSRVAAPSLKGFSARQVHKGRVTDKRALVAHLLKDGQPFDLVTIDEGKLNKLIQMMPNSFRMPGVEVYTEDVTSVRKGTR